MITILLLCEGHFIYISNSYNNSAKIVIFMPIIQIWKQNFREISYLFDS